MSAIQHRKSVAELATEARAALAEEKATGAESRRTHALMSNDPEQQEATAWWFEKTKGKSNEHPEFKKYSAIRGAWLNLVYARHGYDKASEDWNESVERLRKALSKLFAAKAKSIDDIAIKVEVYISIYGEAEQKDSKDAWEEDAQGQFLAFLSGDLNRLRAPRTSARRAARR
jgi:hypothetical protein